MNTQQRERVDPAAARRHREFGRRMADAHAHWFSWNGMITAGYRAVDLLSCMRAEVQPIAGGAEIEPLARIATAAFLRRWRNLQRGARCQ